MRHESQRLSSAKRWQLAAKMIVVLLCLALAHPAAAQPAGPRLARTAYTDEGVFLSDLAALGYTTAPEGFEDDAAWGTVRTTIAGGTHTAPSISNLGITWTANNANSQVTTGPGPARTGLWGFFTLPHGDPASGINDGFVATGSLLAAGGWFKTNTPFAGIQFVIDGDETNPVDFDGNNVLTTQHQFFGVIDTAGFGTVEFRETEGSPDDWKLMFADDFTFAVEPCAASPDLNGDRQVDIEDIRQISLLWGQTATCPTDQNGDGLIDVADIGIVCASLGPLP